MKRTLATTLAILLAASPFPALSASPQDPGASAPLAVALAPAVGCMVAGTNPQVEAGISPSDRVQAGRVYFKSALGDAFYYVEMAPGPAGYAGVLPKPRPDAGPITYYVEGVGLDYAQSQTPEERAVVVDAPADCGTRPMAALGPADPVRVFSTTGGTALPPGFSGVSSVVAGGAGAAGAAGAGAAAAAGGGAMLGTTGLIVAGAVALGVGTAVVISTGGEERPVPPVSPNR